MIFSCAPMFKFISAPPDGTTIEYEIANCKFSFFSAHILL